jgi:hypothetical protein
MIAVLVVGVAIFDMVLVVAARVRERRPISRGGTDHTGHRLAWRGLPVREIALIAYAVQAACCLLALGLQAASDPTVLIATAGLAAVSLGLLALVLRLETPRRTVVELPEASDVSPPRLESTR